MSSTIRAPENEAALVNRALGGDRHAFYALIQPCETSIFMAAWAVLGSDSEAEETAEQAVIKALADLRRYPCELTFTAWIVQITVLQARARAMERDGNGCHQPPVTAAYRSRDAGGWTEIPGEALQDPRFRAAFQRIIASLEAKLRTIFVLRDMLKFSLGETARILGISEADARAWLGQARLQVRDELAPGMNGSWATDPSAPRAMPW